MAQPVLPAVIPVSVRSFDNGQIPRSLLTTADPGELLADEADVTYQAMRDACHTATGHRFQIMPGGGYRDLPAQINLFHQRYETPPHAGRPTKVYEGIVYSLRVDAHGHLLADAAVPGTSNHGYAAAVDVAVPIIDPDTGKIVGWIGIKSSGAWTWLTENATDFGWSWEYTSGAEPWHLHTCTPTGAPPIPVPKEDDMPTEIKLIASDGTQLVWNPPTNTLRWVNDGNVAAVEPATAFAAVYQGKIPNGNSVDDAIWSLITNTVKAGIPPQDGLFAHSW